MSDQKPQMEGDSVPREKSDYPLARQPPEILVDILSRLDPGSFVLALESCRALWEIGFGFENVLKDQIRRLPGAKADLPNMTLLQLKTRLLQQVRDHMYRLPTTVETTWFDSSIYHSIDITKCCFLRRISPVLALVFREDPCVRIYCLQPYTAECKACLRPPKFMENPMLLKVAFNHGGHVACVFQDGVPFEPRSPTSDSAYVLVRYRRVEENFVAGKWAYELQSFMHVTVGSHVEPLGLALSGHGDVAVVWDDLQRMPTSVNIYYFPSIVGHEKIGEETPFRRRKSDVPVQPLTSDVRFDEGHNHLNYFFPGFPIHRGYVKGLKRPTGHRMDMRPNYFWRDIPDGFDRATAIDYPFWVTVRDEDILFLALGMDHRDYTTFIMSTYSLADPAFLPEDLDELETLKHHRHVLEQGRRTREWVQCAQLDGITPSFNSVGNVLATSLGGQRIAIANWRKLLVWYIEPLKLFNHPDVAEPAYFPGSWYDSNGRLHIPPVELPCDGVVHQLAFIGEDYLAALTDYGLMHYRLDAPGTGKTATQTLNVPPPGA
ncbi:MAG: hypothetical protein M4579_003507 [Chaenotheca gracillima]|nr:MAG: hypothetical protein M4579_003507 [Chaenotheca gracillima]